MAKKQHHHYQCTKDHQQNLIKKKIDLLNKSELLSFRLNYFPSAFANEVLVERSHAHLFIVIQHRAEQL